MIQGYSYSTDRQTDRQCETLADGLHGGCNNHGGFTAWKVTTPRESVWFHFWTHIISTVLRKHASETANQRPFN